ncbi:DgyrCDS5453 [Dimorphilus gyrociliatus]|nr:DgyrCDS5453 [Dimorphilus gyrociliatus]
MLNSLSLGLVTKLEAIRQQKWQTLLSVAICQFSSPLVALSLSFACLLSKDEGLGAFYVSCLAGGGLGFIITSMLDGEKALSSAINLLSACFALASGPFWLFIAWQIFPIDSSSLLYTEIWLLGYIASFFVGIYLRRIGPGFAEGLLTWFIKPFLLLFSILFITLGMYINIYMLSLLTFNSLFASSLFVILNYCFGIGCSYLNCRTIDAKGRKAIRAECTTKNSMLALAIVRFTVGSPDSDLLSTMPIWILFATPIPFAAAKLLFAGRNCLKKICKKRKEKKNRHFSIVASLIAASNVASLPTGLRTKGLEDVCDSQVLIDERVTVL